MNCQRCGCNLNLNTNFCTACGEPINNMVNEVNTRPEYNEKNTITNDNINVIAQNDLNSKIEANMVQNIASENKLLNFFKYIIQFLIKPVSTFKNEENKLEDTKNSFIFAGIVSLIMMLIGLFSKIINTIFVKEIDFATGKFKTTIDFSCLEDLDWINLIFRNLLIYAAIILGITIVYYLATLVVKKSVSFTKTLSIASSSILPYIALGMLISPILGNIWEPLSVITMIGGIIYSVIIFYTLIRKEILFEDLDLEIYFHLACMTILGSAGYYIVVNLLMNAIENDLNSYLNMFN